MSSSRSLPTKSRPRENLVLIRSEEGERRGGGDWTGRSEGGRRVSRRSEGWWSVSRFLMETDRWWRSLAEAVMSRPAPGEVTNLEISPTQ